MRRICLTVVGLYLMMLSAFSQSAQNPDGYEYGTLKLEEANIVSSYYSQNGDHSAVTGGIGTQQLTDLSTVIDLKYATLDFNDRKNTWDFGLGLDHHTAASSAYVSLSGSSKTGGTRIYPSINWDMEDTAKRMIFGLGASYSNEYTYHSYGINGTYTKYTKDKNRELNLKGQIFFDEVKLVEPDELKPVISVVTSASGSGGKPSIPSSPRATFDITSTLSQVVNKRFQLAVIAEGTTQMGYLALPFHRVYFTDGSDHIEYLPDTRYKLPLAIRANYFIGNKFIIRSYYRYYTDSWGITAHAAEIETPFKFTPFVSVSPFYRYYVQTAANYFAPYEKHIEADTYYTSNYDYSSFSSQYVGVNFRIAPPKGLFGDENFTLLEIRYGYYVQTTGLTANNISINLRFK
jgi:uncharacterized protein DUF3570